MEHRAEPRFHLSSSLKIFLLKSPDRDLPGRLLDISATGLRFTTPEPIAEGELAAIELGDHIVLVKINNSYSQGDGYAFGGERIRSLSKNALPAGATREQVRALLDAAGSSAGLTTEDQGQGAGSDASGDFREDFQDSVARSGWPPPPTSKSRRSWQVLVASGAGLALAAVAILHLQFRGQPRMSGGLPAVESSSAAPTAASNPSSPPQATAEPTSSAHRVQIIISEDSWLSGSADGRHVFEEVGKRGETKEFEFSKIASLQVGNGGGVQLSVDGKQSAALGAPGEVLLVQLTPEGVLVLPGGSKEPRLRPMSNQ